MSNRLRVKGGMLLAITLLIAAVFSAPMGSVHASPVPEEAGERVGVFGTVTAVVGTTIVLDTGDAIFVDDSTEFFVPGVDSASLANIEVHDRLAIIALELDGGNLLALQVMSTPDTPVNNTHVVGVVSSIDGERIILTDDQGLEFIVELPDGIAVGVGDFLTVVYDLVEGTNELSASDVANIDEVIDELTEAIEEAIGETKELLRELLESNGDQYLTSLVEALEDTSAELREALEAALISANADLEEKYAHAGLQGPYVKVKGFVSAIDAADALPRTVTIDPIDDDEVVLTITGDTEIEEPIGVGDFVRAKFNLELVAKKIRLRHDKLEFEGIVTSYEGHMLELEGIETPFTTDYADIEGDPVVGDTVEVDARPGNGVFIATKVKVDDEEDEVEVDEFKFKGVVTEVSETQIEVGGMMVPDFIVAGGLNILVSTDTEIEGSVELGAFVEVKGTNEGEQVNALAIEVKEPDYDDDEGYDEAEIEFEGEITDISDISIVLDGELTVLLAGARIDGTLYVGAEAEVKAVASPNGLVAIRIEVEEGDDAADEVLEEPDSSNRGPSLGGEADEQEQLRFTGIVASLGPEALTLENGTSFALNDETQVDGAPSVGAAVRVDAVRLSDGTLSATEVRDESDGGDDEEIAPEG